MSITLPDRRMDPPDPHWVEYKRKALQLSLRLGTDDDDEREMLADRILFYLYGADPILATRAVDYALSLRPL